MNTHARLYGSLANVSKHAGFVAGLAREQLSMVHHANGQPLVRQHSILPSGLSFLQDAGPTIGFSLLDPHGALIGHKHLENLATVAGFQIRTGGLCNTGVLARVSGLDDDELKELYEGGRVCGDDRTFPYLIVSLAQYADG
jgi:molybdenum cofactor sulfurtransferase